ncbi:MAG: response regulator transcription factor [Ignavibacterium sp.]|jgi:DNA-binding response OmpR family regulator|uniref:Response regulator transcription factor n=1 Tax=Ignavibacterium album TaxID=591197 RepID=A0A7V3E8I9_9BACT|nr:response regulator transcription factor [Ignavibacterium album]MCA2004797.1 response regulator transcription factor [Ignavibacterium sp.]MCX8105692.1 response regulator transcription factor [Ignavibacterium album]
MSDENKINAKILLVEDEESLATGLEYNLSEEGYEVDWAKDGKQAIEKFNKAEYDLIILDIMLPYQNGFEVAKVVREKDPQIPILMLTARTTIDDKVKGLETGADDYITKPFHLQELLLRIKGMLRRKNWYLKSVKQNPVYKIGKSEINFDNLKCKKGKQEFSLTHFEAILLRYLIENKGRIISRKELLENVWNLNPEVETRTVDIFISRLRKHFEDDPSNPVYIKSIRSSGYIFDTGETE